MGQLYNREPALGALLAVPVLLIIAVITVTVGLLGTDLLARMLDTSFLIGLIVLNLALLGWRLIAIVQAHSRRRRLSLRRGWSYVTATVLLLTLAMHLLPAYYTLKVVDTIRAVSVGGGAASEGRGILDDPLPQPSTQPEVARGERVSILLVGVDYRPGRQTQFTDTMMVVSLDPSTGESAMLSVPRDLHGAPLPDGRTWDAKLNSLMVVAGGDPGQFPLGGPGTLKATIALLLGVDIHYFAAIDLTGFERAVNALGGIEIVVPRVLDDPGGLHLEPGTHRMDGALALAYVRARKGVGESDFTRAERQQQVLAAISGKLASGGGILALPGLLDVARDTISTDVPQARFPELARAVQGVNFSALRRAVIQPPLVTPATAADGAYILVPDIEAIRALAAELLGDAAAASGG